MKVKLGNVYRDKHTGFEGIAVARAEWLTGCDRIGLQSKELKDGVPIEVQWFDDNQLEGIKSTRPGGPRQDPPSR